MRLFFYRLKTDIVVGTFNFIDRTDIDFLETWDICRCKNNISQIKYNFYETEEEFNTNPKNYLNVFRS